MTGNGSFNCQTGQDEFPTHLNHFRTIWSKIAMYKVCDLVRFSLYNFFLILNLHISTFLFDAYVCIYFTA